MRRTISNGQALVDFGLGWVPDLSLGQQGTPPCRGGHLRRNSRGDTECCRWDPISNFWDCRIEILGPQFSRVSAGVARPAPRRQPVTELREVSLLGGLGAFFSPWAPRVASKGGSSCSPPCSKGQHCDCGCSCKQDLVLPSDL